MKNIKKIKCSNFSVLPKRNIKYVIIHYTNMNNQKSAIKRLQSRVAKVSCHYIVSKKGKVYRMVNDKDVAWHAGKSKWKKDKNLNNCSIGIELINNGNEEFPNIQIISLIKLLKKIITKHDIKINNVLGHSDISPGRKFDPGPLFPWSKIRQNKILKKA